MLYPLMLLSAVFVGQTIEKRFSNHSPEVQENELELWKKSAVEVHHSNVKVAKKVWNKLSKKVSNKK